MRALISVNQSHWYRDVEPCIRCNLVIAMGDLAFRFPNLLEPWTHEMYQPLNDPDKGQHHPLPGSLLTFASICPFRSS